MAVSWVITTLPGGSGNRPDCDASHRPKVKPDAWGRLAAVQYGASSPHTFTEMYRYSAAGGTTGKRMQI